MRTIRLLHVEDSTMQQRLVEHHLRALHGVQFAITAVGSEDEALETFQSRGAELVILDYQLTQGNGLSCLRKLRMLDPIVPIIAVSGAASPEIAAELVHGGADDYIGKQDLSSDKLIRSVQAALERADAWRKQAAAGKQALERPRQNCLAACRAYVAGAGPELLSALDELEQAVRAAGLNVSQLQALFAKVLREPDLKAPVAAEELPRLFRPLVLEILYRLAESDTVVDTP